jgi:hypothetical protein
MALLLKNTLCIAIGVFLQDVAREKVILRESPGLDSGRNPFTNLHIFTEHNASPVHHRMVNKLYTHFCKICWEGQMNQSNYNRHLKTQRHKDAVAANQASRRAAHPSAPSV